jgi:glycosyltransferase involved in cell wall biosynthesis
MNLNIYKVDFKKQGLSDNISTLSFSEFKKSIFSEFKINFLKYQDVDLFIYKIDYETNLLLTCLILKLYARRSVYINDTISKKRLKVTNKYLFQLFAKFISSFLSKKKIVNKVIERVQLLKFKNKGKKNYKIDYDKSPLYLRTDLWFGVKSGGSVGHIAGVLNNLNKHFNGQPIFYSTDIIPTVIQNVDFNLLTPNCDYWDFNEIPTIASNLAFVKKFKDFDFNKISLIYQRYSINNFLGAEIATKYNIPLIIEFNGSEVWISKNWGKALKYEKLSKEIEMAVLDKADLIVVVSSPIKNDLVSLGIDPKKILVNPNGVDPEVYKSKLNNTLKLSLGLEDKIVLGFIGTFGPWHGAEILAEAYALLIKKYPKLKNQVHLLMIGDGVGLDNVKEIIKVNDLSSITTFTGIIPQQDGPDYLDCCDILISPHVPNIDGTAFFGSPTKLFEYMSMGKGIVASDLDQIGEILSHNETALLVKPGNITELADGINELIINKYLRNNLGMKARNKIIESYSWEIHTKKIFDRLQEIY